jgi:hypothetical protein
MVKKKIQNNNMVTAIFQIEWHVKMENKHRRKNANDDDVKTNVRKKILKGGIPAVCIDYDKRKRKTRHEVEVGNIWLICWGLRSQLLTATDKYSDS